MNLFGGLFFTVFFFSLFIFHENKTGVNDKRNLAERSISSIEPNEFDKSNYRRSFFSLSSKQKIKGLIYESGEVDDYIRRVFGTLIQQAHQVSIENNLYIPNQEVYKNYNTFLLLALQVPMHESSLTHFRKMPHEDYCYFSNDVADPRKPEDYPLIYEKQKIETYLKDLKSLIGGESQDLKAKEIRVKYCKNEDFKKRLKKKITTKDYNHFMSKCGELSVAMVRMSNATYLYNGISELEKAMESKNEFIHCSDLAHYDKVNQILFSNDYSDVGILMFNAKSHPAVFRTGQIFNFDFVLNYGLNYLFKGYEEIINYNIDVGTNKNKSKKGYECFESYNEADALSRINAMRGAWSGHYNSGQGEGACRFMQKNHLYKNNDFAFARNLAKILFEYKDAPNLKEFFKNVVWTGSDKLGPSLLHRLLPKESLEYSAYEELIANVVNGTNEKQYISEVLDTDYSDSKTWDEEVPESEILEDDLSLVLANIQGDYISETAHDNETEKESDFFHNSIEQEKLEVAAELLSTQELVQEEEELNDEKELLSHADNPVSFNHRVVQDIAKTEKKQFLYHTFGVDLNIRTAPTISAATFCANTKEFGNGTFTLQSYGVTNSFHQVSFKSSLQQALEDKCPGYVKFYIYKLNVRKKRKGFLDENVMLIADRTLRNTWGQNQSMVLGTISASEKSPVSILITNEHVIRYKGKEYIWYEFLHSSGEKRWFWDGISGESTAIRGENE